VAGTIVAMGGLPWQDAERRRLLEDYVFALSGKERPRVLFVPTAVADAPDLTLWAYSQLGDRTQVSHVSFFPWPPAGLRDLALEQDVIFVSGGNTANALAIWRTHGFDEILREAWKAGVVLTGWSAGMLCWFEAAVTDSFGPQLQGMRDGLGFLPGSRSTRSSSRTGFLRAWPPTTALRSGSTASSWPRSSAPAPAHRPTGSRPPEKSRLRPVSSGSYQ
jgi:dipeptidase E